MTTRQTQIPGTERTEIPDVEAAAEAYRAVRNERMALSKREAMKKLELLAVMRAREVKRYRYHDGEGVEQEAVIDDEPTVKVRETGEAEDVIGEGVSDGGGGDGVSNIPDGLIASALKSQEDANVVIDEDGDVQVADKAAPKTKRGRKPKAIDGDAADGAEV